MVTKRQWGKKRQQFKLVAQNPGSIDDSENQGRAQLQRVEEKKIRKYSQGKWRQWLLVSGWKIGQYCSLFSSTHTSAHCDTPGCPRSSPQHHPARIKAHSISRNTTKAHIFCSPEQPPALPLPGDSLWSSSTQVENILAGK